jgi:hypothetical protein
VLAFVVGAVMLWTANDHGFYWIMAGVVVTPLSTLMNVRAFMVETLR